MGKKATTNEKKEWETTCSKASLVLDLPVSMRMLLSDDIYAPQIALG